VTPWRAIRVASLVIIAASCRPRWAITLDDGSTATAPSFSLSRAATTEPARIAAFRVDACTARGSPPIDTHWLTVAPAAPDSISRIVYGTPPTGWRSAQGPHPLTPGCYRAAVADAPPLEFDVLPDGRVTARH
jgi:hypothetical protein